MSRPRLPHRAKPPLSPADLKVLIDAAALLIRSGFKPEASLEAVGLDPIDHFGLLPVTLQSGAQATNPPETETDEE